MPPHPESLRRPRRTTGAVLVPLALLTGCIVASGCTAAAAHRVTGAPTHRTTITSTPPPTTSPQTTGTTAPLPLPTAPARPTGVGTTTLDLVDPNRPTVQFGHTLSSSRHLPTIVRYPAIGPAGDERPQAPAAPGPWPLIVFAHGYNVTPATYGHLLHAWADAGFVVAAPAFPLETAGGPLDENDLNNEPRDISVVIDGLLSRSAGSALPLAHLIDPSRVAVSGHSDGAEAALAAGFTSGDARIGPVISMAAQGIVGGPHPDARHPLLVVQGTQDTINPPALGDAVYGAAGRPRFELRLVGGGHLPPIADDTPWRPIVEQFAVDFLRRFLTSIPVPIATLGADGNRPGVSTLTTDP